MRSSSRAEPILRLACTDSPHDLLSTEFFAYAIELGEAESQTREVFWRVGWTILWP